MIKKEEVTRIGQFNKPHGIKGELSFTFSNDVFDGSECEFLICELNGIFVPFLLESYKFKSDVSAFVKLKGIDSEQDAKMFTNLDVYFPTKYIPEIGITPAKAWSFFVGFTMEDVSRNIAIGEIIEIEESTANTLFIVENNNTEYLIPAAEDWIVGVDMEEKILQVELPEGLIDL